MLSLLGWRFKRDKAIFRKRAKLIPMRAYLALTALRDREEGQAMVEYALILALVSVAAVGILSVLGKSVSSIFSEINQDL